MRRIHDTRDRVPVIPATRLPQPAITRRENPAPVTIRHPAPRVGRYPRVTKAGVPKPGTVHERVPSHSGEIGLPTLAITRDVVICAVVVKVAHAVAIRHGSVVRVGVEITLVILLLLLVPIIVRILFEVFRDRIAILIGKVECGRLFLTDFDAT